ncbi:MAG: type II 3-dehydroquinate dehydratase [Ruthenibacterium sp.]
MKLLILNGPNINLLGVREPELYGTLSYHGLVDFLKSEAARLGVEVEFFQSNHEGALVDVIQNALGRFDGIVINPAAYTHTSIAILDALKAVALPAAEVHLSDVSKREDFRQISYAGLACRWHFIGEGKQGYVHAMEALLAHAGDAIAPVRDDAPVQGEITLH